MRPSAWLGLAASLLLIGERAAGEPATTDVATHTDTLPPDHPIVPCPIPAAQRHNYASRPDRQRVSGRATILCRIDLSGKATECTWRDEDPPGYDFGQEGAQLG